jgi:hypothetical protein
MVQLRRPSMALIVVCLAAATISAQELKLPQTRNAALRYWMAFALLQDPPADKDTVALLQKVADGTAPWDEARLGAILDKNTEAILIMQRATRLPECDWGLEYELGPETPVAHLAKARVLARLNVLYGMRLAARHDSAGAVDAWLAGLRFARHLTQGASLIGALTAKAALVADLNALSRAVANGSLDEASITRVNAAVRALPEYGFDWRQAVLFEVAATESVFRELRESRDARKTYRRWLGGEPPTSFSVPSVAEVAQWKALMVQAASALQLPNPAAVARMAEIEGELAKLNPLIRFTVPSLARINEARGQISAARENVLRAIDRHRDH